MSKQSEGVKRWRATTKQRMVAAMGGQCQCCGYHKCYDSLDFHHLNPNDKEISLGKIMANPRTWDIIVAELRKCVLVCSNCHGEIHAGITKTPPNHAHFDEAYTDYTEMIKHRDDDIVKDMLNTKTIDMIAIELGLSKRTIERRIKRIKSRGEWLPHLGSNETHLINSQAVSP